MAWQPHAGMEYVETQMIIYNNEGFKTLLKYAHVLSDSVHRSLNQEAHFKNTVTIDDIIKDTTH